MDAETKSRIEAWSRPPFDDATIQEVSALVKAGEEKELEERFYRILEFGTGGLRGVLGAGTNRMNTYTVGMATQGLANYIKMAGAADGGVVIARDSRRMSDEFSRVAASVFAGNGIPVFMFRDIAPTPFASFAIRHLKATSGIVITASHNPPEYNGYKVYWDDGGQIVTPHDKRIIDEVEKIDTIDKIAKKDFDAAVAAQIIRFIDEEIFKSYVMHLEKYAMRERGPSRLKVAYTPLHGTGYRIIPRVLTHFGFDSVLVQEEQSKPDGDFPTVKYPNPEEKDALELVVKLAHERDADIILATDPDADRMGVGFKDEKGEYLLINGNQIGTMLEYYILKRAREKGTLGTDAAVVKTIVTTDLQGEIARAFNCRMDEVLTGFKWIASKMKEYDQTGAARFVFGGEESYGYLPVPFVRDKDAVSSCYFFAEMADWLLSQDRTMRDFLDEIYTTFGLYQEDLHSMTLKGMDGIRRIGEIMESFRQSPPSEFTGIPVKYVSDMKNLVRREVAGGKTESITGLPSSDVIQFSLDDGTRITMRPSGTEPKIKFYFSVREKTGKETLGEAKKKLRKKLDALMADFISKVEKA